MTMVPKPDIHLLQLKIFNHISNISASDTMKAVTSSAYIPR